MPLRQRHSGMWKPGQSGNPQGRPKSDFTNYIVRDLARMRSPEAVHKLMELATRPDCPDAI